MTNSPSSRKCNYAGLDLSINDFVYVNDGGDNCDETASLGQIIHLCYIPGRTPSATIAIVQRYIRYEAKKKLTLMKCV